MRENKLVQIPFDTKWMDDKGYRTLPYKSGKYVPSKEIIVRGGINSYINVDIKYIDNIQEFAKGFLFGALYKLGLTLDEVVFLPADHKDFINNNGEPVYIFLKDNTIQLESWFIKESEYNKLSDKEYM